MDSSSQSPATSLSAHPWGLLPSKHLCCPCLTPSLHPLSLNTGPLEILGKTRPVSMEDGVPTSLAAEGTCLLCPDQIFIASMNPLTMMTIKVIGREISSATVAEYTLPIVPNIWPYSPSLSSTQHRGCG